MRSIATKLGLALLLAAAPLWAQTRFDLGNQVKNQLPVNYLGNATGLSTPTADTFSTSTTGGTLTDATTYYYRVSATSATGETLAFAEQGQLTGSGGNTNTVTVNWLKVNHATGYKVYCRSTGAELLCATITSGDTLTWADDGSVTPSGALPTRDSSGETSISLGQYGLLVNSAPNGVATEFINDFETDGTDWNGASTYLFGFLARTTGTLGAVGSTVWGGSIGMNFFPPNSTKTYYGLEGFMEPHTQSSTAAAAAKMYAGHFNSDFLGESGTLSVTTGGGITVETFADFGSTVTDLVGIDLNTSSRSSATATTLTGIRLETPNGGGTVGTYYGLNIIAATSDAGNSYGINIGNISAVGGTAYAIKTGTGLADFGAVVNAATGYRVAGAATSGRYLKGDGTNFVQSSGSASGVGTPTACTNQFVTGFTLNSDAAPTSTCTTATLASAQFANQGTTATVLTGNGSGNPSFSSVSSTQLATANKTISKSIVILTPTTSQTNLAQFYWPSAVTVQRVACSTDTGTATIQFDERAEGTPNTAGTNMMTSSLVCSTSTATTTSFSDSAEAADVPINLQVTATSGTPGVVRIHVRAGIN